MEKKVQRVSNKKQQQRQQKQQQRQQKQQQQQQLDTMLVERKTRGNLKVVVKKRMLACNIND